MVAGQPPFEADTTIAILMKHVNEPIPDIRRVQKEVPDELILVIAKALAKDRNDLYQPATNMAAALRLASRMARVPATASDAKATVYSKRTPSPESAHVNEVEPAPIPVSPAPSTGGQKSMLLVAGGAIFLLLLLGLLGFFILSRLGRATPAKEGEAIAAISTEEQNNLP